MLRQSIPPTWKIRNKFYINYLSSKTALSIVFMAVHSLQIACLVINIQFWWKLFETPRKFSSHPVKYWFNKIYAKKKLRNVSKSLRTWNLNNCQTFCRIFHTERHSYEILSAAPATSCSYSAFYRSTTETQQKYSDYFAEKY